MTSQSPRIYLYKITFEEVPYYYYGTKKEKKYNEEYWGSPKTNKWCWELYTPKKQILQLFDFTDMGYKECLEIESRLIKPVLNDKLCLNESYNNFYSLKILSEAGKKGGKITGNKNKEENRGIFKLSEEERKKNSSKGGLRTVELGIGLFGMDRQILVENGRKLALKYRKIASQKTNSQRWECCITGYVSNSGGLSIYQKARGIDTSKSNRRRIS
jgi:hypothetical protein